MTFDNFHHHQPRCITARRLHCHAFRYCEVWSLPVTN